MTSLILLHNLLLIDKHGKRLKLSKIEYQFEEVKVAFSIEPHGNNKYILSSYKRTQSSTMKTLREELDNNQPRIAVDSICENIGGITKVNSAACVPRNLHQAYNMNREKKTSEIKTKEDPYMEVILECKEQAKNPSSQFIQSVVCAPEPIVVLFNKQQLDEIINFCTKKEKFCPLQADATFDLGDFSVTTTQYEHLLLLHNRSNKSPAMIGPILIHQRKLKASYQYLPRLLVEKNKNFQNLCCLGTDGEVNLANAFKELCPSTIHLLCHIHFKNNIKEKLKNIGASESSSKQVIQDIFGEQIGNKFEEGLIDADSEEEFHVQLMSLKVVWEQLLEQKGLEFYEWFQKQKSNLVINSMLKDVRRNAGLGDPPSTFTTNRVESINSILKLETNKKKKDVYSFIKIVQETVERQQRNIEWAMIGNYHY